MAIFEFEFMRKAFLVGILLAVIIPCIGIVIVPTLRSPVWRVG